jgi:hypothetical protein
MAETDNPWKQALDELFPLALMFFLPEPARKLNPARGFEALETELRPLLPISKTGLKRVDKLVKVWRKESSDGAILESGAEEEDYYHFEAQYQKEADFEKRMSDYNDVARVQMHNPVVSVAILGDEDRDWRPSVYHWEKDGCEFTFKFKTIKLLDWRGQEEELYRHDNPFALFVLAHLLILPTENDPEARAKEKFRLWCRACGHKMEVQDLNCLLRLIDWMLLLPQEINRPLLIQFQHWREDNPMPFISVFEQEILDQKQQLLAKDQQLLAKDQQLLAKDQESRANCLHGIALALKLKFQKEGETLFAVVQKQTDVAFLQRFLDSIEAATTCEELRKLLP